MKALELLRQLATVNVLKPEQTRTNEGNPLLADLFPTVTYMLRYSWKKVVATITFAAIFTSFPGVAGAWTWVLHHQGFAPNSNANWTNLRVGVYSYDKNDPDQQISFVWNESKGAHMLVNLSNTLNPKLCYTASSTNLLAELVLRTCDRTNSMQQFKVHNAGNVAPDVMNVMVQLKDTNLCFANSERYNYGKLVVDNCRWGQNHADQFFYMEKVSEYIHDIPTGVSLTPAVAQTIISNGRVDTNWNYLTPTEPKYNPTIVNNPGGTLLAGGSTVGLKFYPKLDGGDKVCLQGTRLVAQAGDYHHLTFLDPNDSFRRVKKDITYNTNSRLPAPSTAQGPAFTAIAKKDPRLIGLLAAIVFFRQEVVYGTVYNVIVEDLQNSPGAYFVDDPRHILYSVPCNGAFKDTSVLLPPLKF